MARSTQTELLTDAGVNQVFGLTQAWLRKGRRLGFGPAYIRVGGTAIRYRRQDIEAYLNANRVEPMAHQGNRAVEGFLRHDQPSPHGSAQKAAESHDHTSPPSVRQGVKQ